MVMYLCEKLFVYIFQQIFQFFSSFFAITFPVYMFGCAIFLYNKFKVTVKKIQNFKLKQYVTERNFC